MPSTDGDDESILEMKVRALRALEKPPHIDSSQFASRVCSPEMTDDEETFPYDIYLGLTLDPIVLVEKERTIREIVQRIECELNTLSLETFRYIGGEQQRFYCPPNLLCRWYELLDSTIFAFKRMCQYRTDSFIYLNFDCIADNDPAPDATCSLCSSHDIVKPFKKLSTCNHTYHAECLKLYCTRKYKCPETSCRKNIKEAVKKVEMNPIIRTEFDIFYKRMMKQLGHFIVTITNMYTRIYTLRQTRTKQEKEEEEDMIKFLEDNDMSVEFLEGVIDQLDELIKEEKANV